MSRASSRPAAKAVPRAALVRALRHLLRPLVRLLLANQITHPFLSDLLKGVFVELADREFAIEGKRQTTSRLSLLTGIHRKDVKRLREAPERGYAPPPSVSLGARLVSRWTGRAEFLDEQGRPRPLRRLPDESGGPSFEQLVASVSKDIRPRAVLDEWRRLGVVEVDDEDFVRLVVEAFVPAKGFDEKAHYFGRNVHDHVAAAAHNVSGEAPPMLERSVYYDGLSAESVAELADLSERLGMDALKVVDRRARTLKRRDAAGGKGGLRMNFGIYFLRARMEDRPDESEPKGE